MSTNSTLSLSTTPTSNTDFQLFPPSIRFGSNQLYLSRDHQTHSQTKKTNHHINKNKKPRKMTHFSSNNDGEYNGDINTKNNGVLEYADKEASTGTDIQSHSYSNCILKGFQLLKSNRILCDVTLVAQGKRL